MPKQSFALVLLMAACGGGGGGDPDASSDSTPSVAITISLSSNANATFVGFRDGDGAWRELTGVEGVYEAASTDERFGIWVGCVRTPTSGRNRLTYRTRADGLAVTLTGCPSTTPVTFDHALTGIISGADLISDSVELNTYDDIAFPADVSDWSLGLNAGPNELFASLDNFADVMRLIRRDLGNVTADVSQDVRFEQDGVDPLVVGVEVNGFEVDETRGYTSQSVGPENTFWYLPSINSPADAPVVLDLPNSLRRPGDVHNTAFIANAVAGMLDHYRGRGLVGASVPTAFTLPPAVRFAAASQDGLVLRWTLPAVDVVPTTRLFGAVFMSGARSVTTSVNATSGWLSASTTLAVDPPTSLPGFDPALAHSVTDDVSWSIEYAEDGPTEYSFAGTSGYFSPGARQAGPATARVRDQMNREMHAERHRLQ